MKLLGKVGLGFLVCGLMLKRVFDVFGYIGFFQAYVQYFYADLYDIVHFEPNKQSPHEFDFGLLTKMFHTNQSWTPHYILDIICLNFQCETLFVFTINILANQVPHKPLDSNL